jgi:predicted nucleotidyltransferase component of viral defense system
MNRSRAWFESASRETGFRADTLEKVVRLGELASEVARHPLLGGVLALKGGTALNLGFGPPRRLSVDLDFNFVGSEDRDEMLARRPLVERSLESLARSRGYRLQWSRAEHAGRKAYLRYISSAGVDDRIEVDLNFLHRVAVDPPFSAELWQPADAERPSLHLVGIGELIAGKLCALLERGAPRDLFDATQLPAVAGAEWGSARIRSLFVALAGTLNHPVHTYGQDRWRRIDDRAVREQLHPTLAHTVRPDAYELREAAWAVLEPLLRVTAPEREYTDRLQTGDLRPELLFPSDPETATRLARHPALLWKARNAARHGRALQDVEEESLLRPEAQDEDSL